ncbi:MAG TPA: TIGR02996 domain-containing protein, partial [Kofleriaceae bacterium]|nr:TIGR02996 domain-containing protein [Kofleriaceae bacterium]
MSSHEIDELYARVAASPAELGPRLVLADALQLAGDPRGELIALQLAIAEGIADAKARSRAAVLAKRHLAEWTAALPDVVHAELERGFLSVVHTDARGDALDRSLALPEWATVERLELVAH